MKDFILLIVSAPLIIILSILLLPFMAISGAYGKTRNDADFYHEWKK